MVLQIAPQPANQGGVPAEKRSLAWGKMLILLLLLIGGLVASRYVSRDQLTATIHRASEVGWIGCALFVVAYAIWCLFGLPASIFTMAAAVTFGFWKALGLVLSGAGLAAVCGFGIARYVARDWFTEKVGQRLALAQINQAVGESGWRIVLLTRIPPISPFSWLNYAYGLTPVKFRDYVIGTFVGMIPGTAAYVYLGTILGDVAQAKHRQRTPLEWGIYIAGFIATVVLCVYLVRMTKRALARHSIEE